MRTNNSGENWDLKYEIKAVLLLALGFALVTLDRNLIYPLFPTIAKDLGLNYRDLGMISASLSLCWGISAMSSGRLADKFGTKRVLVPAVVLFSLLVGFGGFASGMVSLAVMRGLLGVAEGAYQTAGVAATVEASKLGRLGRNVGLQQMSGPLVGLAFCPVFVVWALKVLPSWHWVFVVVVPPGLIVAALLAKVLRSAELGQTVGQATKYTWRDVMRHGNVLPAMMLQCCSMSGLVVLSAFLPHYLTDYLKLDRDSMGTVLAGLGVGASIGLVALPALSDRLGRRPVIVGALLGECIAIWVFINIGAAPLPLFVALTAIALFVAGVIGTTIGPLASESVPHGLGATATGAIVGVAELIGGVITPVVTGGLAVNAGISVIVKIALGTALLGLIVAALWIREPRRELPAQGMAA
ncbi:MFS transporter [Paraburkholderia sp. BR10937]|uniref:MFS transporter n=1 Tax=Paraburkholderia sp. BR10937 TaxID=3236994 RepID=UPI0034D26043